MSFPLLPKSVTLNDLERRNGYSQVIRTEMTKDQTGRTPWDIATNPDPTLTLSLTLILNLTLILPIVWLHRSLCNQDF